MAKDEKNKKAKEKSVIQIAREMEAQQQKAEQEAQAIARQQAEQERLAYEEQLKEEKKELLRLKQGVIAKSDTIYEIPEEEKKYTFGEKVSNFIYHNKWWMGIAAFFVVVTGFLIWQAATTIHPDMIILLLVDDDAFHYSCSEQISELFQKYITDNNNDGQVVVDVYYIPASDETAENSGYTGDSTKLFAEFQIGEAVLVISDEDADQFIVPDSTLTDLEPYFGDYAETQEMRFYLSDTDFAKAVGWEDTLDDDIYIGIRTPKQTMDSEEEMQEVFDFSFPALEQFVQEFGHLKTSE